MDQYCLELSEYSRALEHVHSSMHVAVPFPEAADVKTRFIRSDASQHQLG